MRDEIKYINARCDKAGPLECWNWTRSVGSHGYGNAWTKSHGVIVAHRLSYIAFVGKIPNGALVQHSCDNKRCVNPRHLSVGTDATNATDKQIKGRAAKRLDAISARYIFSSNKSQRDLARQFGVHQVSVWRIKNRLTWAHVTSNL